MSFKVVKKVTYVVTTPEGDIKEIVESELLEKIKKAKEQMQTLQKFITDAEAQFKPKGGPPSPNKTTRDELPPQAHVIYAALSGTEMTVSDLIEKTQMKEYWVRVSLSELFSRNHVYRRNAMHKGRMSYLYGQRPQKMNAKPPSEVPSLESVDASKVVDLSGVSTNRKVTEQLRRDQ